MAVELQKLIHKVENKDVRLVAGKEGMSNLVTWVHMVEVSEVTDFLTGGEIAFITGIGISSPSEVLSLVEHIYEKHAAGVVINTGPFLEKIPEEVVSFCEENGRPLFEVPWRVHLAEIMRVFCYEITLADRKTAEIAAAFRTALLFPKQEELYVVPLSQRGFPASWSYTVIVAAPKTASMVTSKRMEKIEMTLSNYMSHSYQDFSLFHSEDELIAITGNYSESKNTDFVTTLRHYLNEIRHPSEIFYFGAGKSTGSVRCIYKSYRQAKAVVKLLKNGHVSQGQIFYSKMGFYKLLMNIEDQEVLEDYCKNTIAPVVEYDKKNNSSLVEVLSAYLKNNGSVKETADELYVHRNTVNYKLNKIKELTGMNLSAMDARLQLSAALMVINIL